MSEVILFTSAHISSLASRAAELERLGEELQDPYAFVRAARLYTLAVRIADDIDHREALPFMRSDLARVHDELRRLALDRSSKRGPNDSNATITRMFREVALGIEQRLAEAEPRQPATGT